MFYDFKLFGSTDLTDMFYKGCVCYNSVTGVFTLLLSKIATATIVLIELEKHRALSYKISQLMSVAVVAKFDSNEL
jgi:hypothetical protein